MDYEKKYKDALEWARKVMQGKVGFVLDEVLEKFPELKESEGESADEKVRKALIKLVTNHASMDLFIEYDIHLDEALSWLEKQGEQKPKFRVGDTIKCKHDDRQFTIKSVDLDKGTYTYTQEGCGNDIDYADEEFELVEQKPAWSEEDEEIIEALNDYVKNLDILFSEIKIGDKDILSKEFREKVQHWLKSIKDRVQQPKQEWSDEDKKMHDFAIRAIGLCKQYAINHQVNGYSNLPDVQKKYEELQDWLKSLKLQNTWKPSERKIQSVRDCALNKNIDADTRLILDALYQDLLKLREK